MGNVVTSGTSYPVEVGVNSYFSFCITYVCHSNGYKTNDIICNDDISSVRLPV